MTQAAFATALRDADAAVPSGLTDPTGRVSARRFAVYRNNVVVSLTEALATGFPVVRKLVGEAFFTAMAGVFVRAHPPQDRRLQTYGDALPAFLAAFPPARALPYLPDVARLELALRQSYHAADAVPLNRADVPEDPEALAALRAVPAPAVRMLASPYPVLSIWGANREGTQLTATGPEEILAVRPAFDPYPVLMPPGGRAFLDALRTAPLGAAAQIALTEVPGADIGTLFALALDHHALTDPT